MIGGETYTEICQQTTGRSKDSCFTGRAVVFGVYLRKFVTDYVFTQAVPSHLNIGSEV